MSENTYTRDGETEYELVYDLPDDADASVHLIPVDADEGARSLTVTRAEFDAEFEPVEDADDTTTEYLRERARNGHGIQ